jgi:splicing factor 3B subunit 3
MRVYVLCICVPRLTTRHKQNGVLLRTVLDGLSGELSDTRTRFVGTRPVRLEPVRVGGERGLLALSSRTWLCYNWQSRYQMTPLSYMPLAHAAAFSSEQCPSGIVAVAENTVRIVAFDRLGEMFNVSSIPLRYTPRKFVVHPLTNNLVRVHCGAALPRVTLLRAQIVIESEHNSEAYSARAARALAGTNGSATGDGAGATTQRRAAAAAAAAPPPTSKTGKRTHANADDDDDDADGAEEGHTLPDAVSSDNAAFNSESAQAHEREYGRPPAGTGARGRCARSASYMRVSGRWASCIRVLDAVNARTHSLLELTDDECAVSLALVTFAGRADELLLLVGVARGMTVTPRAAKQSFLHTYRFGDGGKSLVLLHRTPLDAIPGALAAFDGRLLAGVGATLRIYDLGKKKLLRKVSARARVRHRVDLRSSRTVRKSKSADVHHVARRERVARHRRRSRAVVHVRDVQKARESVSRVRRRSRAAPPHRAVPRRLRHCRRRRQVWQRVRAASADVYVLRRRCRSHVCVCAQPWRRQSRTIRRADGIAGSRVVSTPPRTRPRRSCR